mgnify:CR=1 FL=1
MAKATAAIDALTRAGITFTTHAYDHDPRATSYGMEAAELLGLDPAAVFKTLLAAVDGEPAVGIVPVAGLLDVKALAAALGGRRAEMIEPAAAERITGYVVGGISPIAQKRALRTVLDESAIEFERIYVSGGRRGLDVGLAPDDLIAVTGGDYAAIARSRGGTA